MELRRISEHFGIDPDIFEKTGVFNAVIGVDSLFFLDPLRLKETNIPEFTCALLKVREYYGNIIKLLKTNSPRGRHAAIKLMALKEIKGVGIGHGDQTDDGSAVGVKLATKLVDVATELIEMNIIDPAIFEIMGMFENDFGPDRLSDSLINILRHEIYLYTQRMSKELKIPTAYQLVEYETTWFLPEHPSGNKPLLFIPSELLRDIPVATSYEEISAVAAFNDQLRAKFNEILAPCFVGEEPLKKYEIKEKLFKNEDNFKILLEVYKDCKPSAYNFEEDPKGLYAWVEKAKEIITEMPLTIPASPSSQEVPIIVSDIIQAFKKFIEIKGGWRGLYNNTNEILNERHARLLFYATALGYQGSSDIDISPESNAGQGPVDFKASRGNQKVVVEVKLSKGKVFQGYEVQTGIYQKSEDAQKSFFVVLKVTQKSKALNDILKKAKIEDEQEIEHPEIVVIDALPKLSASKAEVNSK